MGQTNLKRTHFEPRVTVLSPKNDNKQDVDFTGYFEIGDFVDVIDEDANGNILNVLADNLTILAINDGTKFIVLSAVVDTTAAVGTPKIRVQQIDDGFEAVDRLYRRRFRGSIGFNLTQDIEAQALNSPIAGQTTFDIDDASLFKAGDEVDLLADEGLIGSDVVVVSVNVNADASNNKATVVVSGVYDTSTFTNPFILNKTITVEDAIRRNQEKIDGIDQPIENEHVGIGNNTQVVFDVDTLFIEGSSKLFADGKRLRKGTAGTRASHVQGAGNGQLTLTSMILGLLGNRVRIQVVNAAGFTVSVSQNFSWNAGTGFAASSYLVQVNNDSGTATSQEIAEAINANVNAQKIMQARWGGDGTGTVAAFGPTALAGGLDNGIGDYAELEQVFENSITGTGFKWMSIHIRPNEINRLNSPFSDDEELCVDYRKAISNVDR